MECKITGLAAPISSEIAIGGIAKKVADAATTITAVEESNKEIGKEKRDKAKRFAELAESRVTKVLYDFDRLMNLSNRSNYTYTQEQVDEIFSAIDEALESVKASFRPREEKKLEFKFGRQDV